MKTDTSKKIYLSDILEYEIPDIIHKKISKKHTIATSFKAKANETRSLSEKLADFLTLKFGTMWFLGLNVLFFAYWLLVNSGRIAGIEPHDPFPYPLLTTVVSLEAIFLSIIVLISQNRNSRVDDIREEINLQITGLSEAEITKMIELQVKLLKKNNIDVSNDVQLAEMLEPVDRKVLERRVEKELDD